MRSTSALGSLLAVIAAIGAIALPKSAPPADPPPAPDPGAPRVKLAVLVVFDQMRADYLERWRGLFGAGGFARLQTDGAWFTHCHYPYACTITGPGHASMLTGTCPDRHGIVNNEWYESGAKAYCAGSLRYQFVPASPPPKPDPKNPKPTPPPVGNPDRLLAETVADVLRGSRPGAKVFGLSLKDRSAILPTGKRPDGAYWFHDGRFVTSTYYDDRVHPWVREFNDSKFADRWFGQKWERSRPDIDYVAWSGPDDVEGESVSKETGQGKVFPHPMGSAKEKPGKEYYGALASSPFGNDLLLEFAKRCVIAEGLGADDIPDLLVVSFSSNDLIGHAWGPDSQEVLDVTLRSDAQMAELLAFLDEKVGRGQYVMAVTADHGVCPLVEVSKGKGIDARRVDTAAVQKSLEKYLAAKFGTPGADAGKAGEKKSAWVEAFPAPWLHINAKLTAAAGRSVPEVARAAADFLRKRVDPAVLKNYPDLPDIAHAYTRADLAKPFPPDDSVGNRARRALFLPPPKLAERCGDVYVILRPFDLPAKPLDPLKPAEGGGTTHGAPYAYDTHVPLLVYGPGIRGGARAEPTTPQATAAIFSRWLGLRLPNKADFPAPATLEEKP